MKPWMIERMEQERRENEWRPQPLRVPTPPPGWAEEQARRESDAEAESNRGVWHFQM